jgi:hypothetical protein
LTKELKSAAEDHLPSSEMRRAVIDLQRSRQKRESTDVMCAPPRVAAESRVKDPFRETAEEVPAAVHRGRRVESLVLAARRHSVEQAVGAGAAEGEANEMPENSMEMEGI